MRCSIILKPVRELPTGRGFADFVYIPKPEYREDYPAMVVELNGTRNAKTALDQIKTRNNPQSVLNYTGDILMVELIMIRKIKNISA